MSDFSSSEERVLAAVRDAIIPPGGETGLPGAGELGLVEHIAQAVQQSPELGPLITQGLASLDELASAHDPRGFVALDATARAQVLHELAATQPAFVPTLTFHTFVGYYQNGRVVEALGLEHRPPHPLGYEIEPNDLTLLDPVRERPPLFRES